ncbi:DinB family protein [Algoriphagus halophilus]|uniref:DinB superfamily protein n=1 Tax=Algoriphagus halophilus TaxID=226505 RepID=A0A1N6E2V2_9BACT|nr:DinB family protein [Algoriphagus halophilus]SIN77307.1 DinB superfamily protein [Algoriphagus halophilus]
MKTINQPNKGDYSDFFSTYLNLVAGENFEVLILDQIKLIHELFLSKDRKWAETAYDEGKWTPKEVLGHIIDTERIMTFRALCFARGEQSELPGFDQDPYVFNAKFGSVSLVDLLEDFKVQRMAMLSMLKTLPEDSLDTMGKASGNPITPRALFWIIPGHFMHHFTILQTNY